MNITSMSGQELYKTLFGRDVGREIKPDYYEKWMKENPPKTDEYGRERYDRLIVHTEENTTPSEPDTSSVISLFETGHKGIAALSKMNLVYFKTDKEFTEYYGAIGGRLDEAYAAGKFTEDEYNELNKGLSDLIAKAKERNDYKRANAEWIRESAKASMWELQIPPPATGEFYF
jgi:hypothetical protein